MTEAAPVKSGRSIHGCVWSPSTFTGFNLYLIVTVVISGRCQYHIYISSVNIFFSSSNFSIHRKWIIHGIPDTLTLCPSVWQIPFCYRSSNYVYTVFDLLWYMAFLAVFVHVRCIHMYHVPRVLCVKTCVIKKMAYHSIETGVYMNRHIREMYLHVSWHVQTLALYQNKIIVSHEPLPDPHLNHGKSVDNNLQLWPAISNLCLIWRKKYFWSCPS